MSHWMYLIVAVCAGMALPFQAGINASLAKQLGSAPQSAWVSFLGGLLMMSFFCWVKGAGVPSLRVLQQAPPHLLTGGFLGGTMVITVILLAPKIGAVAVVACLVVGQLLVSVIIDHYGWVGFHVRPISAMRLLGVAMLIAGVFIIQRY